MKKESGYYFVNIKESIPNMPSGWHPMRYCVKEDKWYIGCIWYTGSAINAVCHEIDPTRIPAPDEILETEDSLSGFIQTVIRLTVSGIDFHYNAKSQNLTYNSPGAARIITTIAISGFNFGDKDK